MSYILDALKKSQQERELGEVPTITTDQLSAEQTAGDSMRWVYSAVLLAVAALAIAVFGMFFRSGDTPAPDLGSTRTAEASATPIPRTAKNAAHVGATAAGHLPDATTSLAGSGSLPSSLPPPGNQPPARVAVAQQTAAGAGPYSLRETVPLLRELPLTFQQSVPEMNIDVHVFLNVPTKRFVFINQRRYREGEQTTEGPSVEEIIPEGVIFRHEGQRFRLTL